MDSGPLAQTGVESMTSTRAAAKTTSDHVAEMHLQGRASWRWVIDVVVETISQGGHASELFEEPLAAAYGMNDEVDVGWVVRSVS